MEDLLEQVATWHRHPTVRVLRIIVRVVAILIIIIIKILLSLIFTLRLLGAGVGLTRYAHAGFFHLCFHLFDIVFQFIVFSLHLYQMLDQDDSMVQWHRFLLFFRLDDLCDSFLLLLCQYGVPKSLMLHLIRRLVLDYLHMLTQADELVG